jgi:hypothetical protein
VAYEDEIVLVVPERKRMVDTPTLICAVGANTPSHAGGGRVNKAEPRSVDVPGRAALTPESSWELGFCPSQEAILDDIPYVPRSFDIVDLGNGELGLLGYLRAPLLLAGWGHVAGNTELACSPDATAC